MTFSTIPSMTTETKEARYRQLAERVLKRDDFDCDNHRRDRDALAYAVLALLPSSPAGDEAATLDFAKILEPASPVVEEEMPQSQQPIGPALQAIVDWYGKQCERGTVYLDLARVINEAVAEHQALNREWSDTLDALGNCIAARAEIAASVQDAVLKERERCFAIAKAAWMPGHSEQAKRIAQVILEIGGLETSPPGRQG